MGIVRNIALTVLGISGITFVALFGRLPAFRKTPIGFLHRLIWIHIPNGFVYVDFLLFSGKISRRCTRYANYIMNENHPLVLIFFISLLSIGTLLFVPSSWSRMSTVHRLLVPPLIALPYGLLYKCVVTKPFITRANYSEEMKRYPYDHVIFDPGNRCRTCLFLKPARSKHCSFCKACVSRHDHHCIWLANCVGFHNYRYFLSLLLSLSILLIYGICLGYSLLHRTMILLLPQGVQSTRYESWTGFFHLLRLAIAFDTRVGAVFLLVLMTAPLAVAFLVYHIYLIWAGMTTSESAKWSELGYSCADGHVFKSSRTDIYGQSYSPYRSRKSTESWPVGSDQIIVLTEDGQPPKAGDFLSSTSNDFDYSKAAPDHRWSQVRSLKDVDNIYDLGFWDNLRDAMGLPVKRPT